MSRNRKSGNINDTPKQEFQKRMLAEIQQFSAFQKELDALNNLFSQIEVRKAFEDHRIVTDIALDKMAVEFKAISTNLANAHIKLDELAKVQLKIDELSRDHFKKIKLQYDQFLPDALNGLQLGYELPDQAMHFIVSSALSGNTTPQDVKQVLLSLSDRTPSEKELLGGATSLREGMVRLEGHTDAVDIVGTGGDGHNTFNISTATALVVAAHGVKVAKHGNRSASSRSGSADVLEALGVNVSISPERASKSLDEIGIAFLFAQTYHPTLRKVANVRKELGKRTIFNLLGPLSNPARVTRTLLGVYAKELLEPMAWALHALGVENAWVVHGSDKMDEVTTTGPTSVARLQNGTVVLDEIDPTDAGLRRSTLAELKGGDALDNAKAIRTLLEGEKNAFRDIVLLNASVALTIAGIANDIRTGIEAAAEAIGSGRAKSVLGKLEKFTSAP